MHLPKEELVDQLVPFVGTSRQAVAYWNQQEAEHKLIQEIVAMVEELR